VLELRHVLFSGASSEKAQGSMNLASNTASVLSTTPSRVAAIQNRTGWPHPALYVLEHFAGVRLEPAPVQGLSRDAELDNEILGQVHRLDLAALLLPKAK
jgi:hypothetical protein